MADKERLTPMTLAIGFGALALAAGGLGDMVHKDSPPSHTTPDRPTKVKKKEKPVNESEAHKEAFRNTLQKNGFSYMASGNFRARVSPDCKVIAVENKRNAADYHVVFDGTKIGGNPKASEVAKKLPKNCHLN